MPPPPPPPAISPTLKRKKWTEEEERSLIDKFSELQSSGILSRIRTREKKFRPIASHVNACHNFIDPVSYPFLWSWKDISTKVQNMRHQYLLVKQKLLLLSSPADPDWSHGLSLWPNFLRYRDVFGDPPLPPQTDSSVGLGLGFDCSDYEEAPPPLPDKSREMKRRRREERLEEEEREWEDGMERRRAEWRERMDGMMERHRAEMEQIRARALQEQQAVVDQLIGVVSNWAAGGGGGGGGIGDVAAMGGGSGADGQHYVSQMMMGTIQGNGMVPGENRVGGDGADDQFIVDG